MQKQNKFIGLQLLWLFSLSINVIIFKINRLIVLFLKKKKSIIISQSPEWGIRVECFIWPTVQNSNILNLLSYMTKENI